MFERNGQLILYFVLFASIWGLGAVLFVTQLLSRYQKRQRLNKQKLDSLQIQHENNILKSQIQVQEQTFQNISREIHDNIGQKLSLAKLQLKTLKLK